MEYNVSPQEAAEALSLVEQAARHMRRTLSTGVVWGYLVLWGIIWTLGYLANQFIPKHAGLVWIVLDAVGIAASFGIGAYYGQRVRSKFGTQLSLFWLAWIIYGILIVFVAHPSSATQIGMLITLLVMFAYVVMGIWTRSHFLGLLGAIITVVVLISYLLVPWYFNYVMALVGIGMAAGGVYIRVWWR